jgi:hypothetical protein
MSSRTPSFGPCCICGGDFKVRNVLMLHRKSPIPGRGWGCVVCKLPNDGAVAVLCDPCFKQLKAKKAKLRFACKGYPSKDGRVSIDELAGAHDHDMRFHPETVAESN